MEDHDSGTLYNIKVCKNCRGEIVWGCDLNNHYSYFHVESFSVWCRQINKVAEPMGGVSVGKLS